MVHRTFWLWKDNFIELHLQKIKKKKFRVKKIDGDLFRKKEKRKVYKIINY